MLNSNQTRIGHIGFGDHRFCGRSVLFDLIDDNDALSLAWLGLTGKALSPEDRQVLNWTALCAAAADARVWPLKITRVLASYGNPYAGFFGGQIATPSDRIGAGSLDHAAQALEEIMGELAQRNLDIEAASVEPSLVRYLAKHKRLNGFGVPFRKEDERLSALMNQLSGHPAQNKPYWRLAVTLMQLMRQLKSLEPNIGIAMAALLMDLGIPAQKAPFVCSVLVMSPTFAAHACEAAEPQFRHWRRLSCEKISYKGKAPRTLK